MSDRDEVYDRQKCDEVTTYVPNQTDPKDVSVAAKYYDLVTDFYEVGWGKCFHYAPQGKGETYEEAILKYEMNLANAINLKPKMKVLDAGCGVGGPMINIAKATGCNITGITICDYQIKKGKKNVEKAGLSDRCRLVYGDFMKMDFEDNSFDAIYALETTCHAPNKTECFKEMFRVLKPGHFFGGYEWCVKPNYDENNPEHYKTIQMVEHSTQTQKTATFEEVNQALKDAGFELLEARDVCTPGHSWCGPLYKRLRRKKLIRKITDFTLAIAEKLKLAPKGSCQVAAYLEEGAAAFIEAEKLDIFTPNYFFLARKPIN
ncbi:MAG: hypothetical protein COT84_05190 [Chlamydiae bacterium CG10_big_fil_rev_8_21_14_0_10_35_9]|nr:MAG: hypothetical protein COT84_05190 [Chlamydiae bacterium CG10_big_fil_rev_8_21_14_0_10_35_9]